MVQDIFNLGIQSARDEESQESALASVERSDLLSAAIPPADASLITITQRIQSEMARMREILDYDLHAMAAISTQVRDSLGQRFSSAQTDAEQLGQPVAARRAITGARADITAWPVAQPRPAQSIIALVHQWVVQHREALWIVVLLLITALAHGINMMHFPYYEDDEGTYMSQAWAVLKLGRLAPYTYWYDHAPIGWIQIAGWSLLTGVHTFGTIIASGRVFMLLMQLSSTFLVYSIARKVSRSILVATLAALLFALSPYGIYYHRRVLLDNIATFWMLLSIRPLVGHRLALKQVWLSAVALGISILSKEVIVCLIPIMSYLVFWRAHRSQRFFATLGWVAIVSTICSMYFLMATLKGELFPMGTWLGGTSQHVSLLGTLQWQASRGKDGGLVAFDSKFWYFAKLWIQDDPMLVVGGSLAACLSCLLMPWQRIIGVLGLTSLSFWLFLGRGGEVIAFYLVPLLPLLSLNIALVLGWAISYLRRLPRNSRLAKWLIARLAPLALSGLCLMGILQGYASPNAGFKDNPFILWNGSQAIAQIEALTWIVEHIPTNSTIIIDQYMWTDLHDNPNLAVGYERAHYYWKVEQDPEIHDALLHGDWRNVDYVFVTPQMLDDTQRDGMKLIHATIIHSTPIARFDNGEGWPVEIRQVQNDTPLDGHDR